MNARKSNGKWDAEEDKKLLASLMETAMQLPQYWKVIGTVFVILSMFDITRVAKGEFSFAFRVTNTTAIFLALIWLPALMRVFALVGGNVKTPVGEITSSGLASRVQDLSQLADLDTQSEFYGTLIAAAVRVEKSVPSTEKEEVRQILQGFEEEYAALISSEQTSSEMEKLAQRYKELRQMPSGAQRTMLMESVAGRMRALAPTAKFSHKDINAYLQSHVDREAVDQGKRLAGLSILEWSGDVGYFDQVLHIINGSSTSAFEQYRALRIVDKMLPHLDNKSRRDLQEALESQCEYNEGKHQYIKNGTDRWLLSKRLLSILREI